MNVRMLFPSGTRGTHAPVAPASPLAVRESYPQPHRRARGSAIPSEADHDARIAAAMVALTRDSYTVAVVGAKGGVGATTVALLAGLTLAEVPGARPVVVELVTDGGSVAWVLGSPTGGTAVDLLPHLTVAHRDGIGRTQGFLTLWGRLPVLAAPPEPNPTSPLTPDAYGAILSLLSRYYNLVLLDCGSAVTHPLAQFACRLAHHVLLVAHPDPVAMHRAYAVVTYLTRDAPRSDARAGADLTVLVNGTDATTSRFFAEPRWKEVIPSLNATVAVPPSEPLRRRLAAGTLGPETVPADIRRATKGVLAPVLDRLIQL